MTYFSLITFYGISVDLANSWMLSKELNPWFNWKEKNIYICYVSVVSIEHLTSLIQNCLSKSKNLYIRINLVQNFFLLKFLYRFIGQSCSFNITEINRVANYRVLWYQRKTMKDHNFRRQEKCFESDIIFVAICQIQYKPKQKYKTGNLFWLKTVGYQSINLLTIALTKIMVYSGTSL